MKKTLLLMGVLAILMPLGVLQAISSEIHVASDGKASVTSAKVMQLANNTFFARLYWGDAFMRFTIKTNTKTKFFRATGEPTTIDEIHSGDLLDVVGELESGSNTFNLVATSVKNASVQKEHSVLSGNVAKIDAPLRQFTMYSTAWGPVIVKTSTTTVFTKGNRTLDLEHLRVGDKLTKVTGDYNIATQTMIADSVTTHLDMSQFNPRLFVGKLAEAPSGGGATSIKVVIDNVPYTVALNNKTLIIRENRGAVTLARFVAGDTIRIWGALREVDEPTIDAEVVRNMNL